MTTAAAYIYPLSIAFNGTTYDVTSGGPMEATISNGPTNNVAVRPGGATYATLNRGVYFECRVEVRLCDPTVKITPNTNASLVLVVSVDPAGTTKKTATFVHMTSLGKSASQPHHSDGSSTFVFVHESADGTTDPESWA